MFAASNPSVCCFTPHFCWLKPSYFCWRKPTTRPLGCRTPTSRAFSMRLVLVTSLKPRAPGPQLGQWEDAEKLLKSCWKATNPHPFVRKNEGPQLGQPEDPWRSQILQRLCRVRTWQIITNNLDILETARLFWIQKDHYGVLFYAFQKGKSTGNPSFDIQL